MTQDQKQLLMTVAETAFWTLAIFFLFHPEAWAAMPIPGWDRMVTDTQDHAINQGGLIMGVGGGAISAFKMVFSGGEFGMGNLLRTGGRLLGRRPAPRRVHVLPPGLTDERAMAAFLAVPAAAAPGRRCATVPDLREPGRA